MTVNFFDCEDSERSLEIDKCLKKTNGCKDRPKEKIRSFCVEKCFARNVTTTHLRKNI